MHHFAPIDFKNHTFDTSIEFEDSFYKFDEFRRTHQNIPMSAPRKSAACKS